MLCDAAMYVVFRVVSVFGKYDDLYCSPCPICSI